MGSPCSVCSLRSSARCFCTFPIACPRRRSAHLPLDGDRSGMECGNQCPSWVKRRRTHYEQMFSAVHPITDHSWAGPSKALGEIRGLLLSLVGERFEPRANCSASYCARRWAFRTVLKLRSTKLWRKMSSPTANCRLFGNLQYGHSPGRSPFVGDFGAGRPSSIQTAQVDGGGRGIRTLGMVYLSPSLIESFEDTTSMTATMLIANCILLFQISRSYS